MREIVLETWSQGGIVLVPIFLSGFWGFFLVFKTYAELGSGIWKVRLIPHFEELRHLGDPRHEGEAKAVAQELPSLVRYGVLLALENRRMPEPALRHLLEEKLAHRLFRMERHIPMIKSLAAAAPLLGLLGTVRGLIHTFEAMTEFGGSNSQLLARGISEALIATQTGLFVAITLILLGQRLEGRVTWFKNQVEYGITMLFHQFYPAQAGSRG